MKFKFKSKRQTPNLIYKIYLGFVNVRFIFLNQLSNISKLEKWHSTFLIFPRLKYKDNYCIIYWFNAYRRIQEVRLFISLDEFGTESWEIHKFEYCTEEEAIVDILINGNQRVWEYV